LLLTGALWLALHYGAGAGRGELPHPWEAMVMRLHALAALMAVFLFGVLASSHVQPSWRATWRRHWPGQRRLGITLCALGAALALTGYALMYLVSESVHPAVGWLHTLAGAAMAAVLVVHQRAAQRRRPPHN
jgi:Ca2+/Na+ antiporter